MKLINRLLAVTLTFSALALLAGCSDSFESHVDEPVWRDGATGVEILEEASHSTSVCPRFNTYELDFATRRRIEVYCDFSGTAHRAEDVILLSEDEVSQVIEVLQNFRTVASSKCTSTSLVTVELRLSGGAKKRFRAASSGCADDDLPRIADEDIRVLKSELHR